MTTAEGDQTRVTSSQNSSNSSNKALILAPAMQKISFILLFLISLCACQVSEENKAKAKAMSAELPDQVADSVHIIHSEQGIIKVIIKAPNLIMRDTPKEQFSEFPNGIAMEFFNKKGDKTADLLGDYGYDNSRQNERIVRDSVVIITDKGDTIKTDELIMLEQKDSIHNNGKYFSITKQDGTFLQGYGLVANNSFQNIRLNNVFQSQYAIEEDALSSPSNAPNSPQGEPVIRQQILEEDKAALEKDPI